MLEELIGRLEQPLPEPVNLGEALSLASRANRERKAAAVALKKLAAEQGKNCQKCDGAGEVFTSRHCMNLAVCPTCHGTGTEKAN